MPLIDTTSNDLTEKLISDIVLQLLSYIAQKEREKIKERAMQGIAIAKANGVKFGRPKMELPDNFEEVVKRFCNREINNIEACKLLNMSRRTFFRYVKLYRGRKNE